MQAASGGSTRLISALEGETAKKRQEVADAASSGKTERLPPEGAPQTHLYIKIPFPKMAARSEVTDTAELKPREDV